MLAGEMKLLKIADVKFDQIFRFDELLVKKFYPVQG